MKVQGKYELPVPAERVYEALQDPDVLTRCIPGCEQLEATGEDSYKATMKLGVAAIRGTYNGKIAVVEKHPTDRLVLAVEGSGNPGFVKGQGTVHIADQSGKSELTVAGDAQVGGKLAGVAQRMLPGVSKQLMNEFFKRLESELTEKSG